MSFLHPCLRCHSLCLTVLQLPLLRSYFLLGEQNSLYDYHLYFDVDMSSNDF